MEKPLGGEFSLPVRVGGRGQPCGRSRAGKDYSLYIFFFWLDFWNMWMYQLVKYK